MGKWTLEHHDEVLRNKVKNMVQGAVKRMSAEKESPSITYEAFVEDLDEGDAFTASLFDILVKEMAERRTRPDPADRRFISERTAKALHMQAAPLHVYRPGHITRRSRTTRRSFPVLPPRYSNFHDVLSESDGDEDYGTALITSGTLEGARINTDLYDAYFPSTVDLPGTLSRRTASEVDSPPPVPSAAPAGSSNTFRRRSSPPAQSPPTARSIWYTGLGGASSSSLTRQPTIRRPYHSRTTDFNEFTSRRRSAIRNSATEEDGPRADSSDTAVRPSVFGARSPQSSMVDDMSTYGSRALTNPRRRTHSSFTISTTTSTAAGDLPAGPSAARNPSSSELWYSLTSPLGPPPAAVVSASGSSAVDADGERPQVVAPRLRRGGLRPPEMVLAHDPTGSDNTHTLPPMSSTAPLPQGPANPTPSDPPGSQSTLWQSTEPSGDVPR